MCHLGNTFKSECLGVVLIIVDCFNELGFYGFSVSTLGQTFYLIFKLHKIIFDTCYSLCLQNSIILSNLMG